MRPPWLTMSDWRCQHIARKVGGEQRNPRNVVDGADGLERARNAAFAYASQTVENSRNPAIIRIVVK